MGTGYHAGLAEYYLERKNGNLLEVKDCISVALEALRHEIAIADPDIFSWTFQEQTSRLDRIDLDYKEASAMLTDLIAQYYEQGRMWGEEYEVLMVEESFLLPLWYREDGSVEFSEDMTVRKGTVDLVLRGPDGWTRIVDHKTAKKKWQRGKETHRKTPQPGFYIGAIKELLQDDNVTFVYDIASWQGDFQRLDAHRTDVQIEAVKSKARATALVLEGNAFMPNTTSFLCTERFCDYWYQCPYGEALEGNDSEGA
tara:strand:+ start:97 stop:861 length:765 start_codon:yes stop_codon:yes gene_type:complete